MRHPTRQCDTNKSIVKPSIYLPLICRYNSSYLSIYSSATTNSSSHKSETISQLSENKKNYSD